MIPLDLNFYDEYGVLKSNMFTICFFSYFM